MHIRTCAARQLTGILLVLVGVLLVFLCLPMQFFLIVFGVALGAAGSSGWVAGTVGVGDAVG